MFIGHFVIAELIIKQYPSIPPLPILLGVGYPDILWPFLVYTRKEKVSINPSTPLQKAVKFVSYPYSHSLVLSSILTIIPAFVIAFIYKSFFVGILFYIAALSHWFLDIIMHLSDMPILGFFKDRKIGFGLWRYPRLAFVFEFLFFFIGTVLLVPSVKMLPILFIGSIFHLINANSFFAFTKTNPTKTSNGYAILALFGFVAISLIFNFILVK
jgi:hypothetical protein